MKFNLLDGISTKKGHKKGQNIFNLFMNYKPCQLYKGKTEWYIEYYVFDADLNEFKRYKYRKGLNVSSIKKKPALRLQLAKAKMQAINELLENGFDPENPIDEVVYNGAGIAEHIEQAYSLLEPRYKKIRTKQSYRSSKNQFINWLIAENLEKIHPVDCDILTIERYVNFMLNRGNSAVTINSQLNKLSVFFTKLVKMKIIEKNIIHDFDKLKENKSSANIPLTAVELKLISEKLPTMHERLWYFCNFIFYCYLRPNEIANLQYKYINIEYKQITIIGDVSKNGKVQVVKVPDNFIPILEKIKAECKNENDFIFSESKTLNSGKKAIGRSRTSEVYLEFVKDKLDIKKNMYALKHTGAILFLKNGGNTRELQLQMRHHSLLQTEIYIQSLQGHDLHTLNTATALF